MERSLGAEYFDELAVMVDTFRPLDLGEGGLACDDGRYAWSWHSTAQASQSEQRERARQEPPTASD